MVSELTILKPNLTKYRPILCLLPMWNGLEGKLCDWDHLQHICLLGTSKSTKSSAKIWQRKTTREPDVLCDMHVSVVLILLPGHKMQKYITCICYVADYTFSNAAYPLMTFQSDHWKTTQILGKPYSFLSQCFCLILICCWKSSPETL